MTEYKIRKTDMAIIGNSFDPAKAQKSASYAFHCWYNVKYDSNTMRITPDQLNAIEQQWSSCLYDWQVAAENDQTEWEITDEEYNTAKLEGEEKAKEEGGHDGDLGKSKGLASASTIGGVGAAACAGCSFLSSGGKISSIVGCSLAFAVGLMYELTKPNVDEHKALMTLQKLMETGGQNMDVTQAELENLEIVMAEQAQLAAEKQEETGSSVEDLEKLIEAANAVSAGIAARIQNGEEISDADKEKYAAANKNIEGLVAKRDALIADSASETEAIYDGIESNQGEYDAKAEKIAFEDGITTMASSFDKKTRDLAIVTATAHALNAVSGLVAAIQTTIKAIGAWGLLAIAALGYAGAGMSLHAVVQQSKIANDIGKELDTREKTQGKIAETYDFYEGKLAERDVHLSSVDDIGANYEDYEEIELPEQQSLETQSETVPQPTESSAQEEPEKPKNPFEI